MIRDPEVGQVIWLLQSSSKDTLKVVCGTVVSVLPIQNHRTPGEDRRGMVRQDGFPNDIDQLVVTFDKTWRSQAEARAAGLEILQRRAKSAARELAAIQATILRLEAEEKEHTDAVY